MNDRTVFRFRPFLERLENRDAPSNAWESLRSELAGEAYFDVPPSPYSAYPPSYLD